LDKRIRDETGLPVDRCRKSALLRRFGTVKMLTDFNLLRKIASTKARPMVSGYEKTRLDCSVSALVSSRLLLSRKPINGKTRHSMRSWLLDALSRGKNSVDRTFKAPARLDWLFRIGRCP
jgi:hypothetical protein